MTEEVGGNYDPGYGDPTLNRLSTMLLDGWRYEDDWFDPRRLLVILDRAGFQLIEQGALNAERRATVERVWTAIKDDAVQDTRLLCRIRAILDAESE